MTHKTERMTEYDQRLRATYPDATADDSPEYRIVDQTSDSTGDDLDRMSASTASDGSYTLGVHVEKRPYSDAYDPGGIVRIACGVVDESHDPNQGIGGVDLSIEITRNGTTVDTLTATTNEYGGVIVEYTAPDQEGAYDVAVTDGDLTVSTRFRVGEHLTLLPVVEDRGITDTPMTVALHATTGTQPRTGESYDIDVQKPDGSVATESVTTDSDGFATFDLSPSQTGQYTLTADYQDGTSAYGSISVAEYIADIEAVNEYDAEPGDTIAFGGYIVGSGGDMVSNLDLEITVTDADGNVRDTIQATTDTNGVLTFTWASPNEYGDYEFDIQTADGTNVEEGYLDVTFYDSSNGGGSALNFSIEDQSYQSAPGETVTFDISASDDDGPLDGTTVDLTAFAEYSETVPMAQDTVQLDSNGEASVSFTVPDAAPNGGRFDVVGGLTYNGERRTTKEYHSIRRYLVSEVSSLVAGGTGTVTYTIENNITGDPVENAPVMVGLLRRRSPGTTLGTNSALTDANGEASLEYDLPVDTGDTVILADAGRGLLKNWFGYAHVDGPMDVALDVTPQPATAGETVEVTYSTSGDVQTPVNAAVTVTAENPDDDVSETAPLATPLAPSETGQFTAPEINNATSTSLSARGMVIDDRGVTNEDYEWFTVEDSGVSISAEGDTISSGGEAQISFSATSVDTITVEALWIDWEIVDTQTDGATFTDEVASTGSCEFAWSSTQDSAATSITVDLPSRYIGGTYLLSAAATGPDGSADTTATIEIQ